MGHTPCSADTHYFSLEISCRCDSFCAHEKVHRLSRGETHDYRRYTFHPSRNARRRRSHVIDATRHERLDDHRDVSSNEVCLEILLIEKSPFLGDNHG